MQTVPGNPNKPGSWGPPAVIRTYTYDTNGSVDPTYSQSALGRVTRVQYTAPAAASVIQDYDNNRINFSPDNVTEMYSYNVAGQVVAKRLRVQRVGDRPSSTASADLNATWTYNNEGKLTGTTYPGDPNGYPAPPTYAFTYDGIGRLNGMTQPSTYGTLVSGATYNAAGQMTAGLDTRTYDPATGQLTKITSSSVNITYTYPSPGYNIGKISSQTDNLSGEQVTYAYDALDRLTSAQGSGWNQGFVYDPFGNLTDKNGSYAWHGVPDPLTNHLGSTDANGNATGYGISYDGENRLVTAPGVQYAYDGQNKRVFSCTNSCASQTYFFYAPSGKLIAQFTPVYNPPMKNQLLQLVPATLTFQSGPIRVYFGSRMLGDEDRLGSRGKYFPYGEDRGTQNPANDNVKFATYTRDAVTGWDYADQRYYSSAPGRFLTPDPSKATGSAVNDPSDPGSWNKYAYVGGDPINFTDRFGLEKGEPDEDFCDIYPDDPFCDPLPKRPPPTKPGSVIPDKPTAKKKAQSLLPKAKKLAEGALKDHPKCVGLFGSKDGMSAIDVLDGTQSGVSWNIDFIYNASEDAAVASTRPTISFNNVLALHSFVTKIDDALNLNGYWNAGSDVENADTILHELGHVLRFLGFTGGDFVQNDNDNDVNQKNSNLIMQDCLGGKP